MEVSHALLIADAFGEPLAYETGFLKLAYARTVSDVGALRVELPETFDTDLILDDGRLSVMRSVDGAPPYRDTGTCFLITSHGRTWDQGVEKIVLTAECANTLLRRRIVGYAADTAWSKKTNEVDDMMKAIVRENLGSLNAPMFLSGGSLFEAGAERDWSSLLSVQADQSLGTKTTKAFAWRNVLEVLKDLAEESRTTTPEIFFDIVATSDTTLEFRTYKGQRGLDHTALAGDVPVVLTLANLRDAVFTVDRTEEVTAAFAGGEGEGTARKIKVDVDAARAGESPFGRKEDFVEATQAKTDATLLTHATRALAEGRPIRSFTAKVIDSPDAAYGEDWSFGDRVSVSVGDPALNLNCHVRSVAVAVEGGAEVIDVTLESTTQVDTS